MSKIDKALKALDRYFKETSREEIKKIIDEVDKMEFEGPTVEEYFGNFESAFIIKRPYKSYKKYLRTKFYKNE